MFCLICLGRSGQGVDVLCGRKTDVAVVIDVTFLYRESPSKSKKEDVCKATCEFLFLYCLKVS